MAQGERGDHAQRCPLLGVKRTLSPTLPSHRHRRLECLLRERSERIELNGKLEQSRQQVQRLGLENQLLIEMIAAPPVQAAMLAPK